MTRQLRLTSRLYFCSTLNRRKDIETLLEEYNKKLAFGKIFLNIAPHYKNNRDEIYELDADL